MAMDWASKNGHLEVVKWLHKNRTIKPILNVNGFMCTFILTYKCKPIKVHCIKKSIYRQPFHHFMHGVDSRFSNLFVAKYKFAVVYI